MSIPEANPSKSGKITALKQQIKNHDRTSVFIDGEFAFGAWTDMVLSNGLRVGKVLDETQIKLLLGDEGELRGKSIALRYLAYAPRSEHQLRGRLRQEGYSNQEIDHVIHNLRDLGYVDDHKYAMEYASARFKNKGYGPERIHRELAMDGVPKEYISQAIAACISSDALTARARQLVERFQSRVQGTLPERKKKLIDYLIRRGYGYSIAEESVQDILSQSEAGETCT